MKALLAAMFLFSIPSFDAEAPGYSIAEFEVLDAEGAKGYKEAVSSSKCNG